MCDESDRIMRIVEIVRQIEKDTGQKISRNHIDLILQAQRECCDFEINGKIYHNFSRVGGDK